MTVESEVESMKLAWRRVRVFQLLVDDILDRASSDPTSWEHGEH